jgi:DNA-binding transcriptional ArsR family regulator
LNDRRLIIIDEASGLSENEIGNMSGVRSSGIAEITKIQTERTHARTRLIWISNTRTGQALREYGFGVEAIPQLIGKMEDVARFEFVVSCASEEVPMETINQRISKHGEVEHQYTFDISKQLILWAWSRTPDQIVFQSDTIDAILEKATEMGETYVSQIPLVEGANQRIKLARLAVSTAARMYNTPDGERLIVEPEHVQFAYDYLNKVYKKPSLGYWDFSRQIREQEEVAEQAKPKVVEYLKKNPQVANLFLAHSAISGRDLEDLADLDRSTVRRHLKFLAKNGMIRKSTSGYRKAPAFVTILREYKRNKAMEEE